jgi:hypothetical protein
MPPYTESSAQLITFTLRMLVQTASSLHTFAPFTLNRAAIEGAAVAIWLLGPRSRDERIRRRLVLATQNARDFDPVMTTLGRPTSLSDRLDEIRDVARRRSSLDPDGIIGTPPGFGRIIREAGAETTIGSDFAVICWKACSGITHNRDQVFLSVWLAKVRVRLQPSRGCASGVWG